MKTKTPNINSEELEQLARLESTYVDPKMVGLDTRAERFLSLFKEKIKKETVLDSPKSKKALLLELFNQLKSHEQDELLNYIQNILSTTPHLKCS